jgi:diacylglycerol kinase (ATP)
MMIPDILNVAKLHNAICYALTGLKTAFRRERAFRQEVIAAIILAPLAIWLCKTCTDRALLLGSLFLVLIVELINTAIEILVERISSDWHELSGHAKDIGSAAVFVSIVGAAVVWGFVLVG